MLINVVAIRCAPPLSAINLPKIAPKPTTIVKPPKVAPKPFWMVGKILSSGNPSPKANNTQTNSNDKKLFIFTFTIRKNSKIIPNARITNGISSLLSNYKRLNGCSFWN